MAARRSLLAVAVGAVALGLSRCGWTPLYADRETGPADAELQAIKVDAIPERIGQRLALALRESLNPDGIAAPQGYWMTILMAARRQVLGMLSLSMRMRSHVNVS